MINEYERANVAASQAAGSMIKLAYTMIRVYLHDKGLLKWSVLVSEDQPTLSR